MQERDLVKEAKMQEFISVLVEIIKKEMAEDNNASNNEVAV